MAPVRRGYSNVALPVYLLGTLSDSGSTIDISVSAEPSGAAAAPSGWPSTKPYYAVIDAGTASEEVVLVTAAAGSTLSLTRGTALGALGYGTSTKSHQAGAKIEHMMTALDLDEANEHILTTSGVHGLAAGVSLVGTTSAQTLTNKTLTEPILNSPTVNSPVVSKGAWGTMPSLSFAQGVATLGAGTLVGKYRGIDDKTLAVRILFVFAADTTVDANPWSLVGIPANVLDSQPLAGFIRDSSANKRWPVVGAATSNVVDRIYEPGGSIGVTAAVPFAWAVGDTLSLSGVLEIA